MAVFSFVSLFIGVVAILAVTINGNELVSLSSSVSSLSKSVDALHDDSSNDEYYEGVRRLGGYYNVYNDYDKYYGYGGKGSSSSSNSGSGSKSSSKSGSKSGSSSSSSSSSSSGRKGSGSDSSSSGGKGGSGSKSGSESDSDSSSGSKSRSSSGSDSSSDNGRRRGGKRDGKRGGRKDDYDYDDDKNDDERFALRINCGGLGTDDYCEDYRYFNVNGDLWFHDCKYQYDYDAMIFKVDDTIYDIDEYGNVIEADDQEIYQSERFIREKDLVYNFDVNNGRYFIKLYFAENFFSTRKERVFDIAVQGEIVEYDFDIYERVGKNFALVLQYNDIYVDNYKLTIEFIKNIQDPKVNGIEIFQVE